MSIVAADGRVLGTFVEPSLRFLSVPIATTDGRFLVSSNGVLYLVTSSGTADDQIEFGFDGSRDPPRGHILSEKDDFVVVFDSMGTLFGIDRIARGAKWMRPLPLASDLTTIVGISETLFVWGANGSRAISASTGLDLGYCLTETGRAMTVEFASAGDRLVGWTGDSTFLESSLVRESFCCDASSESSSPGEFFWPRLASADDIIVATRTGGYEAPWFLERHALDGSVIGTPIQAPLPATLGADGTVYGFDCTFEGDVTLVATPRSGEQWRLSLPKGTCPESMAIDDAGVGYLAMGLNATGEAIVIAISTDSPGLAKGHWARFIAGDNRGSAWQE